MIKEEEIMFKSIENNCNSVLEKPIIYFQKDVCGQKGQMFYGDQKDEN